MPPYEPFWKRSETCNEKTSKMEVRAMALIAFIELTAVAGLLADVNVNLSDINEHLQRIDTHYNRSP